MTRYLDAMYSPTSHPTSGSARELYLLRQRAETFRVELELESQLRLQGVATLPPEWSTYLEHERQLLLDTIQRMESGQEDFTSPSTSGTTHDAYPAYTLPSIRDHNESTVGLHPTVSPIRPEESVHSSVLPRNEDDVRSPSHASSTTFGKDVSPSPEAHTHPEPISSTVVYGHADTLASPDEHIRHSPPIVLESPSVNRENARRDNSVQIAITRRSADLGPGERADYEAPHATMFNGAQGTTISGGVFYFIQGNISHTSPAQHGQHRRRYR